LEPYIKSLDPKKSIDSLHAIRGISSISVLLSHVSGVMAEKFTYTPGFDRLSFAGGTVDLFFVLSGFIIFYTSFNKLGRISGKQFLLGRFFKIFPIYWVAIILSIGLFVIGKYFFSMTGMNSTTTRVIEAGGLKDIVSSIFLIPNDFRTIYSSWTLSFEVGFYLLFGSLFFRRPSLFMLGLAIWVIVCQVNYFFFHISYLSTLDTNPIRAYLNPIITEFFFGCVVAVIALNYRLKYSVFSFFFGLFLFTISALTVSYSMVHAEQMVICFGFPSAIMIYGAANIKLKFPKWLLFLGDASYSVYIFHSIVFIIFIKILFMFKLSAYVSNMVGYLLISALLLVTCCFMYKYIEHPIALFYKRKVQAYKQKQDETNNMILVDRLAPQVE
jgi:peptidoglycan/LPS O-acetylase OafA/YrhL